MRCKTLFLGLSCLLFAYYIYAPIPENIEEPWKVRIINAVMKISSLMVIFFSWEIGKPCYKYMKFPLVGNLKKNLLFFNAMPTK